MPTKLRTIDVLANPYHAVDADGVPQAVVHMPGTRNYIGARLDHAHSRTLDANRFYFSGEKVTVPFTAEIARAVLEGALIACDAKTAAWCGIAEKDFLDPAKALEAEKAKALAARRAELGSDATLEEPPRMLAADVASTPVVETKTAGVVRVAPGISLNTEA